MVQELIKAQKKMISQVTKFEYQDTGEDIQGVYKDSLQLNK